MLSKVVDSEKGELENQYNGLGFRVSSTRPEERIEYLYDLSRDYFNMLERAVNGETESFIYDKNVISMSKAESTYYYLQDELGSPMYMTGTDGVTVSSYAFDDFGRSLDLFTGKLKEYRNEYSNGISEPRDKHAYTTEGNIIQPFAFTGYQRDEVSELCFAQARYYNDEAGRFTAEDQVRGYVTAPDTQNHYIYCFNMPTIYVDTNGAWPEWAEGIWNEACNLWDEGTEVISSIIDSIKNNFDNISWGDVGRIVVDVIETVATLAISAWGVAVVAEVAGPIAAVVGAVLIAYNAYKGYKTSDDAGQNGFDGMMIHGAIYSILTALGFGVGGGKLAESCLTIAEQLYILLPATFLGNFISTLVDNLLDGTLTSMDLKNAYGQGFGQTILITILTMMGFSSDAIDQILSFLFSEKVSSEINKACPVNGN